MATGHAPTLTAAALPSTVLVAWGQGVDPREVVLGFASIRSVRAQVFRSQSLGWRVSGPGAVGIVILIPVAIWRASYPLEVLRARPGRGASTGGPARSSWKDVMKDDFRRRSPQDLALGSYMVQCCLSCTDSPGARKVLKPSSRSPRKNV